MNHRKMMKVLSGEQETIPPVWMMRQAGRYLPEYLETRKQAGSFLDLCYTPKFAIEVTMQPIRRFNFDAAILFSDILVIPDALGRSVRFEEGRGPILDPIGPEEIARLEDKDFIRHLEPVFETVSGIRAILPDETTLLGFCGAPWTVATYMIAGHGTPDQAPARLFAYQYPDMMEKLLNMLADVSAAYLIKQLQHGADAVQIFDSWSGVLDELSFERWCVKPVKRIVEKVKADYPNARIIGFPKGAGMLYQHYARDTGVDAIGLDWTIPAEFGRKLQKSTPVQGNLDPMLMIAGGKALDEGVDRVLETYGTGAHIFNLGHGITPQAPVSHVEQMLKRIRNR